VYAHLWKQYDARLTTHRLVGRMLRKFEAERIRTKTQQKVISLFKLLSLLLSAVVVVDAAAFAFLF
jgi:uncharacterized membrane protein YbaN (DUF454 family)